MQIRLIVWISLLLFASPIHAERLRFDHRLSPPLKAVFDSNDPGMIDFNDSNPRYVTDLIAIEGKSAKDWTSALLIVARSPNKRVRSADQWVAELQRESQRRCPSTFSNIASAASSITFARRSTGCQADYPPVALYRVIAGKNSLFLVGFLHKAVPSDAEWQEWQAVLASAVIE